MKLLFALAVATIAGLACAEEQPRSKPETREMPAAPAAEPSAPPDVYATRCVVCHGKQGKGDGPGAAALDPKPKSFADPEWQKSVSDEQIADVIVRGGAAVGKSAGMPANRDLENKPEVVRELVKKIRGFAK